MKKAILMFIIIVTITTLYYGCGLKDEGNTAGSGNPADNRDITGSTADNTDPGEITASAADDNESEAVTFQAEIIEAGDSLLIEPDRKSNEYKSSDKMTVSLIDSAEIKNKNGEKIEKSALLPGDIIQVTYNGAILESYPAQITASAIDILDHNLLIDGYLAIIDGIYQEDSGLNEQIKMIAFDTTGWVGLSDTQKQAVLTSLKNRYNVEIKESTYDQLTEEGLIDKENLYFPDGVIITIKDMKCNDTNTKITYSISKWRSGLGAIGSDNTTAEYDGAEWKITAESMWIS